MMLLLAVQVQATPFTADLSITGEVEFDTGFALADGNVTQTGDFSTTEAGVSTSSTFDGTTVTGANPLLGILTDFGDGFGMSADVDAGFYSEFGIGIDIGIDVMNTSATDTWKVTFKVGSSDFNNEVDADGVDAFADSGFTVDVDSSEVFFTEVLSDTLFGDVLNGVDLGTFGELVSDSGEAFFDVQLAPGATALIEGAWTMEGGVFDPGTATVDFSAFLSVDSVENLTQVPEPGTLLLLATGLGGLAVIRRRRTV
jgi:hypothetical protein